MPVRMWTFSSRTKRSAIWRARSGFSWSSSTSTSAGSPPSLPPFILTASWKPSRMSTPMAAFGPDSVLKNPILMRSAARDVEQAVHAATTQAARAVLFIVLFSSTGVVNLKTFGAAGVVAGELAVSSDASSEAGAHRFCAGRAAEGSARRGGRQRPDSNRAWNWKPAPGHPSRVKRARRAACQGLVYLNPAGSTSFFPFEFTTPTLTAPCLWAGVVATAVLASRTFTDVAGTPSNVMPSPEKKFDPLSVTVVPPPMGPESGVTLFRSGAASRPYTATWLDHVAM